METKRKNGLDILRIIATVLIIFHHYQQAVGDFQGSRISFYSGRFYFGYIVELFFVMSGFLAFHYAEKIQKALDNWGEYHVHGNYRNDTVRKFIEEKVNEKGFNLDDLFKGLGF